MKVIEQAVYKESEREPGNQCSASPGAATEGGGPMCQVDHTITLSTYCRSYHHHCYILQIILLLFLHIVDHTITLSTYCRSYFLHILPSFVSLFLESKTNSTCCGLIDIISLSDIITYQVMHTLEVILIGYHLQDNKHDAGLSCQAGL